MSTIKSIDVIVAGRSYPLKVQEEDVEQVKQSIHQLNNDIRQYQMKYGKDDQDSMALTLINKTLHLDSLKQFDNFTSDLSTKIADLHAALDELM